MAAVQRYAPVNLKIAETIFVLTDLSQEALRTLPTVAYVKISSL